MVEIEYLACDKTLELPQSIDTDNYDGQIFCHECNLLLYVRLKSSKVKKYKVVEKQAINVKSDIIVKSNIPRPDYSKQAEGDVKELKESWREAKSLL